MTTIPDPFHWLGEINKASAVMVVEEGIVPVALAAPIVRAIETVIADGARPGAERPGDYLALEAMLIAIHKFPVAVTQNSLADSQLSRCHQLIIRI